MLYSLKLFPIPDISDQELLNFLIRQCYSFSYLYRLSFDPSTPYKIRRQKLFDFYMQDIYFAKLISDYGDFISLEVVNI